MRRMKTSTALKHLTNDLREQGKLERDQEASMAELGRLIQCSRQLVSRWGGEIPELRVFQLRVLKPHWFATATNGKRRRR